MKYLAKNKQDEPISTASLGGKEYKAEDGIITVPDDHHDAHKAAALIGLEHAPEAEEAPAKKSTKAST